jgi:cob(I)alamin adenosyltransferase
MAERLDVRGTAITEKHVNALEAAIDRMEEGLPPLTGFIVPRGDPAAVWTHLARTVCRRAERRMVAVAAEGKRDPELARGIEYLNRLSDYLFVLARACNRLAGMAEVAWER